MQVGNSTISRPPLVIDEYRFAESRAAHPPAFKFGRTWDQSRSSSSCSPVPHFGGFQTSPSPNRGWVYCSFVNILTSRPFIMIHGRYPPSTPPLQLVKASHDRSPTCVSSCLRTKKSCRSGKQRRNHAARRHLGNSLPARAMTLQHVKVPPCHAALQGVDAHVGYFPQAPRRHSPKPPKLRPREKRHRPA